MSKTLSSINTASDTFQNWVDRTNAIITLLDTEVVTANTAGALTTGNGFVNGAFGSNTLVATFIRGGNVTTNSVLTFQTNTTFSANVSMSQQLVVTNTVSFSNTLTVTGNTTLSNRLSVTGNVTLSNTLVVTGNTTLSNTLAVTGAVTLSNTTTIVGLANASGGINTSTANAIAINVGANVNLTTSQISVGNSSVNVVVNSSMITIAGSNVATVASLAGIGSTGSATLTGTSSQVIDSLALASIRAAEYLVMANNNTANAQQVSKILVIHDGTTAYVTEYGTMLTNTSVVSISAGANSTHLLVNCTPTASNTTVKFTRFAIGV